MGSARLRKRPRSAELPHVSMGGVKEERLLPLPFVHYPQLYGTFMAFGANASDFLFCSCAEPAVRNFRQFLAMTTIVEATDKNMIGGEQRLQYTKADFQRHLPVEVEKLTSIEFAENLCHRCNMVTPSWRYCHEMYGGTFKQYYWWYVNQAFLRLGIYPDGINYRLPYPFIPEVCPKDFQEDILTIREAKRPVQEVFRANREFLPREEKARKEALRKKRKLRTDDARAQRTLTKKIENAVRQEFGLKKVGEQWISETILAYLIERILEGHEVLRHARPEWLNGLELDIYVPKMRLAIEYQGQQHFKPVKIWGGEKGLKKLQERDALKAALCRKKDVVLILIDYTEPLTEEYLRGALENGCALV